MVELIVGNKGTGKTKILVDMTNKAVEASKGNVVCIEKGQKLKFDIAHAARLVDTDEYGIEGFDALYGFIAGFMAGNYDITDIFVDATLTIGGRDYKAFANMVERLGKIDSHVSKIVFTVSCDKSDLPSELESLIINK